MHDHIALETREVSEGRAHKNEDAPGALMEFYLAQQRTEKTLWSRGRELQSHELFSQYSRDVAPCIA